MVIKLSLSINVVERGSQLASSTGVLFPKPNDDTKNVISDSLLFIEASTPVMLRAERRRKIGVKPPESRVGVADAPTNTSHR